MEALKDTSIGLLCIMVRGIMMSFVAVIHHAIMSIMKYGTEFVLYSGAEL